MIIVNINSLKNRNPTEERIQETRTYVRVHKSHPGLNCLSFSYEELDNGRVVRVRQKRVAVGWSIVWVFGPLNEAEHNGILLPRQRISHRIQSESRRWIREQNSAVATNWRRKDQIRAKVEGEPTIRRRWSHFERERHTGREREREDARNNI